MARDNNVMCALHITRPLSFTNFAGLAKLAAAPTRHSMNIIVVIFVLPFFSKAAVSRNKRLVKNDVGSGSGSHGPKSEAAVAHGKMKLQEMYMEEGWNYWFLNVTHGAYL